MRPKYSSRLEWSAEPNSLANALEARRKSGAALLDLTQSNPTAAGIEYPDIHTAFCDERILRYDPDPAGLRTAREAVSTYYANRVHPDRILLTASTSEAYAYLFKLLCNPGDEVLVPRPSYPLFDYLARLECVQVTHYPLRYHHGWFVDLPALEATISPRTRAIVCVNPNNPTGSYLKRNEYAVIASLCRKHGLALIADEVFADYELDSEEQAIRTLVDQDGCLAFSLSGLSKICGLPQLKLGWIVAGGPGHGEALKKLEWIADTFLSVGAPVQYAAGSLLNIRWSVQEQIRTRAMANLAKLRPDTGNSPCRVLRVEGGWYGTLQVPRIRSEEAWTLELLNRGVLVQPGFFFDFESEAFLVLSLLTEPAVLEAGLRHILDAC